MPGPTGNSPRKLLADQSNLIQDPILDPRVMDASTRGACWTSKGLIVRRFIFSLEGFIRSATAGALVNRMKLSSIIMMARVLGYG